LPRRSQRLDRKALKQDPLLNFTSRAMQYYSANTTQVLGIAAAVVIGIVLLTFWARGRTTKTSVSDLGAANLVRAYSAGQFQITRDRAIELQTAYPGTRGASVAWYLKGKAEMQLGNFLEAERSFRTHLESSDKAPFYTSAAQQGLGASLEGQGRFAEAAEVYERLADQLHDSLADEARLDAARAYRVAGAIDPARRLLEKVKEKNNNYSRRARIQIALLEGVENAIGPAASAETAPASQSASEAQGGAESPSAADTSSAVSP
jgi:tetratricopeptide (TPR) repeat protein